MGGAVDIGDRLNLLQTNQHTVGQQTLDGTNITELRERYRTLVSERLPMAAQQAGTWPISHDHCFARVVLDNVFEDRWDNHLNGRPADEHLSTDELKAAIDIAEQLCERGGPLVETLHERSLRWRDTL